MPDTMSIPDLSGEPAETLLAFIKDRNIPDYSELAKEAFRVFTFRYQVQLMEKIIPLCKNWGYDNQVATEIGYRTFDRVWKFAKYDPTKSNQEDPEKAILFYLFGIARNCLVDHKKEENNSNPFSGDEDIVVDFPDLGNFHANRRKELQKGFDIINAALNRLSNKHKIIYLTYKQYESEIKDGYKLPRHLLKKLRDELDLTQSSIRVYKKEAFETVDTYLRLYGNK